MSLQINVSYYHPTKLQIEFISKKLVPLRKYFSIYQHSRLSVSISSKSIQTLTRETNTMADPDDSPLTDLSELSEAESLSTDEEIESGKLRGTLDGWMKAGPQPSRKKRHASPPHEYAPEDDAAIAVSSPCYTRWNRAKCATGHCHVSFAIHRCISQRLTKLWSARH